MSFHGWMPRLGVAGMVVLGACQANDVDGIRSGSSSADYRDGFVYTADADNGTLNRVNTATGDVESFVLGLEPARVARIGDRLFVTLRAAGKVVVVEDGKDGMQVVDEVRVGGEPYGIVASPDGRFVYVAQSTADQVVELDASSLARGRQFRVTDQPRWLTMHPSGDALFVACAMNGSVFRIDLQEGAVESVPLPPIERGDPATGDVFPTRPRVTGDPAVSPAGDVLVIPGLYVDNTTSVGGEDPLKDGSGGMDDPFNPDGGGGYATGNPEGLTRFNPAVVAIPLDPKGNPNTGGSTAVLISGQHGRDDLGGFRDFGDTGFGSREFDDSGEFVGSEGAQGRVRGYLSALAFDASGDMVYAAVEGGSAIVAVPTHPVQAGTPFPEDEDAFFGDGAFMSTPRIVVSAGAGAHGLVVDGDSGVGYVVNFLDRKVERFDADALHEVMGEMVLEGGFQRSANTLEVASLEPSILPSDVLVGRRLFYSTDNPSMALDGAGVSCATCHFDGRNDGFTWQFDHGVRQTPSLAGRVSATAPVTWTNDVASVDHEVMLTSQGRMGGQGLTASEALSVGAYIDWSRDVIVPDVDDAAAVERGKALFADPAVGCATCHSGDRYTDNRFHNMVGLTQVNTPGLKGLVASAPYFHDGSALTLRDVVDMADSVAMGHTEHLSDAQKDDLVAFLRTL